MTPDAFAPMIVMVTLILTTGGVILFRPLSKRLAELLHVMTQERLMPQRPAADAAQLRELLERVESRLALLEERQSFTESLLEERGEKRLLAGSIAEARRAIDA